MSQKIYLTERDNKPRIIGRATKKNSAGVVTVIHLGNELVRHEIIFKKPDGSIETYDTQITNSPGSDGLFHYDDPGQLFLDNPEWWEAQARYTFSDGKIQYSNPIKQFYIAPTILD
jgi:hypothetical protein